MARKEAEITLRYEKEKNFLYISKTYRSWIRIRIDQWRPLKAIDVGPATKSVSNNILTNILKAA